MVYDDETVASLVTVITSTSPIPSMPSTKFLYEAQKSLFQVPALAKCKKIIVFDGIRKGQKQLAKKYAEYKRNVMQLVQEDPYFSNTELVFCSEWGHLAGTLKEALLHVDTPFLFIHQHDLVLLQGFDLNGVIASMEANPKIKYVAFGKRANTPNDFYHGPLDQEIEGISFVPLCRSCGWSDQCHAASADYYRFFVLPQCSYTFMESVLHPALKKMGRELFGTYLYGNLFDGPYIFHADARNAR
jgi:hypothetical protein